MGQQASQPARPTAPIDLVSDVPHVVFKEALGEGGRDRKREGIDESVLLRSLSYTT